MQPNPAVTLPDLPTSLSGLLSKQTSTLPISQAPLQAPSSAQYQPPEPEGCAVLVVGDSGSGKSYALTTLIEAGLDLFVFGTEARFMESIQDSMSDRKLPWEKLHWCHVYPAVVPWENLIRSTEIIGSLNYESLTKVKTMIGKEAYTQFVEIYRKMANFVDEKDGQSYGPVDKWGASRALAIDSVTGLALMSMDLIVGAKPVRHEGEWGVAMDNLERLMMTLTSATKCFLVMNGHIEREPDPVSGTTQMMVGTLGKKLSPKWGRNFSEVVHAYRNGTEFRWSTVTPLFALKRRSLPLADNLQPTFKPVVEAWHRRLAQRTKAST